MSPCLLYWAAQHWPQHSRCGLTRTEWRERIPSCDLLAVQPRITSGFLAAPLLAPVQPAVYQHPQVFFPQTAFLLSGPQCMLVPGVVPLQVQYLAILLVELHEVLADLFLQPVKVPLGGRKTRSVSANSPSLV